MIGKKLSEFNLPIVDRGPRFYIKTRCFLCEVFPGVDPISPRCVDRSDGCYDFAALTLKAHLGAGTKLPMKGVVFMP